jgi:hypothetical protein
VAKLGFNLKKEIEDTQLKFEKMSVDFYRQGLDEEEVSLS